MVRWIQRYVDNYAYESGDKDYEYVLTSDFMGRT